MNALRWERASISPDSPAPGPRTLQRKYAGVRFRCSKRWGEIVPDEIALATVLHRALGGVGLDEELASSDGFRFGFSAVPPGFNIVVNHPDSVRGALATGVFGVHLDSRAVSAPSIVHEYSRYSS